MENLKQIWILEDDQECLYVYRESLSERFGVKCIEKVRDFESEISRAIEKKDLPDLVLADLVLEDGNFMEYLENSSLNKNVKLPFIIVSNLDDEDSIRLGFKAGAIDYLTKPFKKTELVVKVEQLFDRIQEKADNLIEGGNRFVEIDGVLIKNLTSKQMLLLTLFADSPLRSVTRQDILDKVWCGSTVHPKTVDVHLYNLRRKLHDYGYLIKSEGGGAWTLMKDTK